MNKNKLKTYAPAARKTFIQTVTDRAHFWGLSEKETLPLEEKGDIAIIGGRPFPKNVAGPRRALEDRIRRDGFDSVMEAVAYTWFNRFMALRYMEIHGYLEHGFRVLSNPNGGPIPEILEQAAKVDLPGLDKSKVIELKLDGKKDSELYRMLLVAQCNALHAAMPFLFERINDETELLLPDNLLHSDSLIRKLVTEIDEEDWREVEIIGWLYQFYISEKKDQVIGSVVKSEDIPAATQLFTPKWIVKYMVQNSLGRMWLATYPQSPLRHQMEYYIEPAEQTEEVTAQIKAITPATLHPELMTFLDPACGSGHILVEAYDIFKEIYLERGYASRDFPRLILEKNLYGLDIDDRAAQMTGFAVLMKAREDDRRILQNGNVPKLNVMAIQESKDLNARDIANHLIDKSNTDVKRQDIIDLIELFQHGKTFGSLITVLEGLSEKLLALSDMIKAKHQSDEMFARLAAESILPFIKQAKILASKFDCVVANPPYMGNRGFNNLLKDFVSSYYPTCRENIFAAFIKKGLVSITQSGYMSMITMHNWMFLSRFQEFRGELLKIASIDSLIHLGAGAFEEISGEVVQTVAFSLRGHNLNGYSASYISALNFEGENKSAAIKNKSHFYVGDKQNAFSIIPGEPIAYWLTERFLNIFSGRKMDSICEPREGMTTGNNAKYVRQWYEVNFSNIFFNAIDRKEATRSKCKWFPYNKGGEYRKWYGNIDAVVNWENDGSELQNTLHPSGTRIWAHNFNLDYIFREAVTWTDITSTGLAARYMPTGCLFDATGLSAFYLNEVDLWFGLAASNTKIASKSALVLNPTLHFKAGDFNRLPIPPNRSDRQIEIARRACTLAKESWDAHEVSFDFKELWILEKVSKESTLEISWTKVTRYLNGQFSELKNLEEENNKIFIEAYGLQDELTPDVPEDQITLARADREADMKRLISYAIGCMMGRYSLDQQGLVYAQSGNVNFDSTKYQSFPADDDGIVPVMDMDWFEDDAACRFEKFLKVAWPPEKLEENLKFVADSLSPKSGETPRDTIRRYISTQFFKDHLQTYKKRPIYWLFSSGKQRAFECLVYLHRYNESTLSRMRNEYVTPLQGKLAARADILANEIEAAATTSARSKLQKQLDTLKKKRVELAAFDDLLRHYSDQRIVLNLDDGVKVNYGKFGNLLAEVKAITGGSE